jgi:hypothetical protein
MINKIAAATLFLVSLYAACVAITDGPLGWMIWAVLFCVAAPGLMLRRRWGQYLVLGLGGLNVVAWIGLSLDRSGANWPYADLPSTVMAILPGLLWISVWAIIGVNLYRQLQRSS